MISNVRGIDTTKVFKSSFPVSVYAYRINEVTFFVIRVYDQHLKVLFSFFLRIVSFVISSVVCSKFLTFQLNVTVKLPNNTSDDEKYDQNRHKLVAKYFCATQLNYNSVHRI